MFDFPLDGNTIETIAPGVSFFVSIPNAYKMAGFIVLLGLFVVIYVFMWFRANLLEHVTLKVNNSTVDVKIGDVFEQEGLKVIAFNALLYAVRKRFADVLTSTCRCYVIDQWHGAEVKPRQQRENRFPIPLQSPTIFFA